MSETKDAPKPEPDAPKTPAEALELLYTPKIVVSGTGTASWPTGETPTRDGSRADGLHRPV
ncbi:MAG: hypothetical protein LC745_03690 [Planctomycetia bacterium]|nr:hypothetical protein [Planctomycetia bacterium]